MSTSESSAPNVQAARKVLDSYSCTETKPVTTAAEKNTLKEAIILITSLSEGENLGICADNTAAGLKALASYLRALGYDFDVEKTNLPQLEQPVYIKFNTQKMSPFLDGYTGKYRGVLIACQAEDEIINGTYGYFPLDLFS